MATIWGIGHNWSSPSTYQLCKSINNGATWTDEGTVPSGMWVIEGIRCFHAIDDDDMYLATVDNGVWHRSSGIWAQVVSSASSAQWYSVWATATDDVWAVGGQPPTSGLVRHWNGSIWENRDTESRAPLIGKGNTDSNFCVWASGPNDVWVVGTRSSPYLGQIAYVIHSADGGATWTDRTPPGPTSYGFGIWGFGPDDVWVCGQPGSGHAFVMHWTGSSWVDVADATLDAAGMTFGPITGRSSSDIWIASIVNWNPKLAHWDGAAWTIVTPDPAVRQWAALLQLAGDTDLWVSGIDPNDASNTMQSAQPPITSWTSRNNPLVSGTAGAGIIGLWAEPSSPPPGHGPFVEQEDPTPGETGVSLYKEISCFITDSDSVVRSDRIDAYVDGYTIYDGVFTAPYNGPNSSLLFVPGGSLDGYDGYRLTIDRVGAYPKYTLYTLRVTAEDMADIAEDHSWVFRTETFAPFFESQNPANGTINVPINTNIYVVCADGYNLVASSTVAVQVNGADAYSAGVGFVAPYNGPASSFVHVPDGSLDGYDAYQITIDSTVNFGYNQLISVAAQVLNAAGQPGTSVWSFTTLNMTVAPPQITHISPSPGSIISQGSNIIFDIFDINNDLVPTTIRVTVDGSLAYSGTPGSFFAPYTGVDSYAGPIVVDGYDGYHIVLDNTESFGSIIAVNVQAQDAYGQLLNQSWGYTTSSGLNRLYYSDDYGVSKIDLVDLVGEGQFAASRFLSTTTAPAIPTNKVISLSGNLLDGYALLVLSMGPDGYGVRIVTNESSINTYADGYSCGRAQISDKGILYLVNKTRNRIEAYYGAHLRPGAGRVPDYVYDGYSTPALFSNGGNTGTILTIHVVSDDSSELNTGARLYVGQSIGMTIIDTFDQEATPGFSAGLDSYGVSTYCGIVGSGATFECIGGTVPNVTDVATDERYGIIFAVTNDGFGHGGLTQITIPTNRKIIFMDESSGFVPSNDIRKVSKNE